MADAAQSPAGDQLNNPSMPNAQSAADDLAQLTKDPVPSFADEIRQFDQEHPEVVTQDSSDYQHMYNSGGKFKEQLEAIAQNVKNLERSSAPERAPSQMTEISQHIEDRDLQEIEGYVEKIDKEMELSSPVTDDYTQQVLLKSANPQDVAITLPLTEEQIQQGLHHKVWEAFTWLANWCLRQIKVRPGRVKYKQEK
jgi:hypothetical protein